MRRAQKQLDLTTGSGQEQDLDGDRAQLTAALQALDDLDIASITASITATTLSGPEEDRDKE